MKIFFRLAVALIILVVLTGAGKSEKKRLTIISEFARQITEREVYQKEIFKQFEEDNNVEISFTTYTEVGALYDKIKTEKDSGKIVTDLVIAHYSDMLNYIENNDYMVNLNDLEAEMSDRNFSNAFDSSTNRNGNRFFFPINTDVYLSIARKEAFDYLPAGLSKEDVLAGNYTWNDFVAWADGVNVKTALKGQAGRLLMYQIGGMALAQTDTIAGTFPALNTVANQEAWKNILKMKMNNAIHVESSQLSSTQSLLESNAIQLAFEHLAVVGLTYEGAPAQFEVFPGPKGNSGKAGTIAGGHGIGIVRGAPNEELARKFIKWITSKEKIVYAALGSIPPLIEATESLGSSPQDIVIKKGIDTIANSNVEGLQMIPDYPEWGAVKSVYDEVFAEIMNGTITTETQLLAKLDEQESELEALKK